MRSYFAIPYKIDSHLHLVPIFILARNGCGILPDYLFCRENKEGRGGMEGGGRAKGGVQEGAGPRAGRGGERW